MSRVKLPNKPSKPVTSWRAAAAKTLLRVDMQVFAPRLRTLRAALDAATDLRHFDAHWKVEVEGTRDLIGTMQYQHRLLLSPELETVMIRGSVGRAHPTQHARFFTR